MKVILTPTNTMWYSVNMESPKADVTSMIRIRIKNALGVIKKEK